jgi:PAS domain S-box-containing protein
MDGDRPLSEPLTTMRKHLQHGAALRWLARWWPLIAVVVIGCSASALVFAFARSAERDRIESALDLRSEWRANDIERKIESAAFPVKAVATFVTSNGLNQFDQASVREFRLFAIQARAGDAPIRSITWAPSVSGAERGAFEAEVREAGNSGFTILEADRDYRLVPAQKRAEYLPALIHVPFEGQQSVLGFDLGADPIRGRAMRLARDTGSPVGTGVVPTVTLSGDEPSYLVAYPIYWTGIVPASLEERRQMFRGAVLGTFRVRAVLAAALENTPEMPEHLHFALDLDGVPGGEVHAVAVFSPSTGRIEPPDRVMTIDSGYRTVRNLSAMGQQWTLTFDFPAALLAAQRSSAPATAGFAGLLLTAALAAYVAREKRRMSVVEGVVQERTGELRQANEALSTLIANLPIAVSMVGPDLRYRAFNAAFAEEYGLDEGGLRVGDSFETFARYVAEHGLYGPGDLGELVRRRVERARHAVSERFEATRPDGRVIDVCIVPLPGGGFVSMRIDVTERRQREQELLAARAQSEQHAKDLAQANFALRVEVAKRQEATSMLEAANSKLQALLDASPLPIVSLDTRRRVLTWNQAAERSFGYTAAEVIGKPYPLVPAGEDEAFDAYFSRVSAGEVLRDISVRRQHKDGRIQDVMFSGAPLYDADLRLVGAVYVLEDVTDKKRIERQLAQSAKMDAIGHLTGGIAHDFNNILGIIVGNLDQQLETLSNAGDAEPRELATEALNAALRGAELVRRLLAFSRSQPLQPRLLNVGDIVRELEPLLWRTLGENITIDMRIGSALWAVKADPTELENVVLNLAINARDAMPDGGSLILTCANTSLDAEAASVSELPAGDYVVLSVADTGTGIPPDVLPHVFEPFFTTKGVGKGSGLGLSMVYGYARQSGGTVRIYSESGRGTEVKVYLPRADGVVASAAQEAQSAPPAARGRERILLVEDKAEVRNMAVRLLGSLGYTVTEVESADAALTLLEAGAVFDLLFTDIVMPGKASGIDLARDFRRRFQSLPIVFTSGFSSPDVLSAEAAALAATIVAKPYRKADLAERLRSALDRAAAPSGD